MKIFHTTSELESFLDEQRKAGLSIGFVPTMGALHKGHLSLIRMSTAQNDITVCSIFVNPKQFNNSSDLVSYPRDADGDVKSLQSTNCQVLFLPDEKEIYPTDKKESFHFGLMEEVMEGHFRPGHFNGVAQVVKRLFEIVMPNRAYFGRKDYQQYLIIKSLVQQLNMPIDIRGCDTSRESDGLARSSRNRRLNQDERRNATIFFHSLQKAKEVIHHKAIEEIKADIEKDFLTSGSGTLEYFEIRDGKSLEDVSDVSKHSSVVAFIAGNVGEVRLIDNLVLIP